ncbi:MAG: hypothetical protein DRN03_05830, partial [Thermoplasmata archaeon]
MSLKVSERLKIISVKLDKGRTKPLDRLTQAELLRLMEENGIG